MHSTPPTPKIERSILLFLLCWFTINCLQAFFTELHPDEAYYWVYSRYLDWGYFDHPPMIALFIKAGYALFQNELGLRLMVVIATTCSIYITWLIAQSYKVSAKTFILLSTPLFVLHIYGFIATPDAPLLLASTLFYYQFRKYQQKDQLSSAFLLALLSACLVYSKYHGILLIGFTLLSDLSIVKRKSFWLIPGLSILLFMPHLYWQFSHDFPSIKYHLVDRSAKPYSFDNTTNYFLNELLISGPLTGILVFYFGWKQKTLRDRFLRTLKFNFIGVFLFFFITSFKGWVEAHWTLIGFIPALILAAIYVEKNPKWKPIYQPLALSGIALIIGLRLLFVIPNSNTKHLPVLRDFFGAKEWAKVMAEKSAGKPIIFQDRFQEPSLYLFYSKSAIPAIGICSWDYRKTQFDIWDMEEQLQGKPAYYVSRGREITAADSFQTSKGAFFGFAIDQLNSYQKLVISCNIDVVTEQTKDIPISIYNPYPYAIHLADTGKSPTTLLYSYWKNGKIQQTDTSSLHLDTTIPSGADVQFKLPINTNLEPGNYHLLISLRTFPFLPSLNARTIPVLIH